MNDLPSDFRDRPRFERWWINVLVALRIKTVKAECCESFRKVDKMRACKGCATLYDRNSSSPFYRLLARMAKRRPPKLKAVLLSPQSMSDTLFAKIIRKEIASVVVYEDDDVFAFLDNNPVNPGHTLVVPKIPSDGFLDTDPETLKKLIIGVQKVARAIKEGTGAQGVNVIQNEGAAAGQKIFHLHYHVIPRFENDGREHWHGKPYPSDAEAEAVAERIRKAL